MRTYSFFRNTTYVALLTTVLGVSACRKEADVVPDATTTAAENKVVNDWILENMQDLYYWNDKIPANPDETLSPDKFFDSILYTYDEVARPDGDRFSWIEESADDLTASLSGETKTTGMEFTLYLRAQNSSDVIAQVVYVLPGSPAATAGMKRGDIISKVNGQTLNTTNYVSLLFGNLTTYTFGLATVSNQALVDSDQTRIVTATTFQEDPVFLDSVYTVGGKTVGYLVYNQFNPAPNGSNGTEYDQKIDAIFSEFKAKGVNELVLDLRYNPGGYTSSSVNLASLIGRGIDANKVYFREEWNKTLTPYLQKEYGDSFFVQNFVNKSQNIGANLQRVFVLTTDYTASASELIINGLRPFMTVTTIGTATYGKNVGSITVTDESGKIKWGMQPIVFKSFNSLGQSDYASGFQPNVEVEEPISLLPLGDTREALLNEALFQITGSRLARRSAPEKNPLPGIGSSIDRKANGSGMFKQFKMNKL
ncbi:peptidase S41 [Fibrisoma limi BUZ 3]|uniref:Peptidase S41 n=1 Tax=Fibrisoma limi BUZ 3 TaxID=1185876 RepID=I2GQB0_9BACT|nr:S41 family peptidase [Fibrisoma limi]CCH56088.1 peptidase S41 [Fibrisoma limi BUZ 3]